MLRKAVTPRQVFQDHKPIFQLPCHSFIFIIHPHTHPRPLSSLSPISYGSVNWLSQRNTHLEGDKAFGACQRGRQGCHCAFSNRYSSARETHQRSNLNPTLILPGKVDCGRPVSGCLSDCLSDCMAAWREGGLIMWMQKTGRKELFLCILQSQSIGQFYMNLIASESEKLHLDWDINVLQLRLQWTLH